MHLYPRRNWHLFMIITHQSYFKGNDLLHMLTVNKIIFKKTSGS